MGEQSLWKDHVYPLWNPYVFLGMPSFASGAYNPLIYPPDWPVALVQKALPLPGVSWMLLYYFLAGLGTFLLARHWGANVPAAIVAGAAFMATPNLVASGAGGGVSCAYATGWSLGPIETLTFLVPGALGFGGGTYWGSMPFTDFPNYMGLALLLCAFLAVAAGRRRFEVSFLLVLALYAL